MLKKALLLSLLAGPLWGSASLTMGNISIASDGVSVTIPIIGVSGSLSPPTGVTGFSISNLSGQTISTIASVTSLGSNVFITLAFPVPNNIAPQFSLSTAGGGSNLVDSVGNTPSASGNTNVSSANGSTWYGCSASNLSSHTRYNARPVLNDIQGAGFSNPCYWASADGGLTLSASGTAINVVSFKFGNGIALYQDGAKISTTFFGSAASFGTFNLATGLTGTHLYDVVQGSGPVSWQDVILGEIQFVGGGPVGSPPSPARPLITTCGDSIIGSGSGEHNSTLVDWWLNSAATQDGSGNYGYAAQIYAASGEQVTGDLDTTCPVRMYPYDTGSPTIGVLEAGSNDMTAGVSTGSVTTAGTFAGDFVTMIRGTQTNSAPPTHLLVQGILDRVGYASSSATYINAEINAVNYVNSTYSTNVCFFNTSGWISVTSNGCGSGFDTADGVHPCGASTSGWNIQGYGKLANRKIPIFAGYISGASYNTAGPSSGQAGTPSTNFTVSLTTSAQFTGDQTIILNDGGNGGVFTPSVGSPGTGPLTVIPSGGATSFTFTYNAASSGSKTISFMNGQQCWTDASSLTYSASNPPVTVSSGGITMNGNLTISGNAILK